MRLRLGQVLSEDLETYRESAAEIGDVPAESRLWFAEFRGTSVVVRDEVLG